MTHSELLVSLKRYIDERISAVERRLDTVLYYQGWGLVALNRIILKEAQIMALIDDAVVEIGETEGKVDELLVLVTSLKEQLEQAGTDPVKLAEVIERMNALQAKIQGALPAPEPEPEPA